MNARIRMLLKSEWFIASAAGLISFLVYLTTLCRTVSFIDAGELATVASVLGIAHPTGYPLFTLVAHCALWIPLPGEEVLRLNIFSALTVAIAVGVFFKVLMVLARLAGNRKQKRTQTAVQASTIWIVAAIVTSLVLGLSTTVWDQSVAIEVYGLHLLLILLTTYLFLRGIEENVSNASPVPRQLIASAFLLGLSFSNHLTTLLIVPALLYLFLRAFGVNRTSLALSGRLLPFFLLGLSPYLYLPIRAGAHPPLEWGFPAELERLIWHVSGKQYRSWMFSSFDSAEKQFTYFVDHFSSEFNWLVIVVMLLGVWKLFRSNKRLFVFLAVAFFGCLFYSINYDIHDIDSYFLLAYVVAACFVFFGIIAVLEFLPEGGSERLVVIASITLLSLPAVQFINNRKEVSEADNHLVEDYVHNVFRNVDQNALIISYQWDYFVAPALYFQTVRKERPDVAVIDKELLRRSWYFIYLKDRYPWLVERSRTEIDDFLRELYKFEHDLPYEASAIEARYVAMINSFITHSLSDRPVYVGPEIEPEFGQGYARRPEGLMFRLVQAVDTTALRRVTINYRPTSYASRLTIGIRGLYSKMLTATAMNFESRAQLTDATYCAEKALQIDPTFVPARTLLDRVNSPGTNHQP